MRRMMLTLAALLTLAGPAAAQSGEQAERWIYVPLVGGATGWEAGAAVYEDDAGTWDVLRFLYFDEPMGEGETAYVWAFHTLRIDCDDHTMALLEGEFYDASRNLVAEMLPEDGVYPIIEQTPEWLMQVSLCDGSFITEQLEGGPLADVMTAVEGFTPQGG